MKARKYDVNGNFVVVDVEDAPLNNDEQRLKTECEIATLKEELASSDYKVAKIAECGALGLPMPYDVEALHKERQAIRDRINELEGGAQW